MSRVVCSLFFIHAILGAMVCPSNQAVILFHQAAKNNDVAVLARCLTEGVRVDALVTYGSAEATALCVAAHAGSCDAVRFLLNHGARSTVSSAKGITPMGFALLAGHALILQLFIDRGADVDTCARFRPNRGTPVCEAPLFIQALSKRHFAACELLAHHARRFSELLLDGVAYLSYSDMKMLRSEAYDGGFETIVDYLDPLISHHEAQGDRSTCAVM